MTFTPKDWRNKPDLTTPLSATALEDLETRLAAYTDSQVGGGGIPNTVVQTDSGAAPQVDHVSAEVDQAMLYYDSASSKFKGRPFAVAFLSPSADATGAQDDINFYAAVRRLIKRGGAGEIQLIPGPSPPFYTKGGWNLPAETTGAGTLTGTWSSASTSVTGLTADSFAVPATSSVWGVSGPGIPPNTTLTIATGTTGTLSNAALYAGSGATLVLIPTGVNGPTQGDPICLRSSGRARLCPVGAITGLYYHRVNTYGSQVDLLAQRSVGFIKDLTIDGQFASGNAIGFEFGDGWGFDVDVRVVNFSSRTGSCNAYSSPASPGAIGCRIRNTLGTTFWTEKNPQIRIQSSNNSVAVYITTSIVGGGGVSNEYNDYWFDLWGNPTQQGVVCDQVNLGGCRVHISGNLGHSGAYYGPLTGNTTSTSTSVTSLAGGTITGNTTNASTVVSNLAAGTAVVPPVSGLIYSVTGTGIPANTTLTITSATAGTLSNAATATGTGVTLTILPANGSTFNLLGPGIPAGATITMTSATAGTLSAAATATGTGVVMVPAPLKNVAMLSFVNGARLNAGQLWAKVECGSTNSPWSVYCDGIVGSNGNPGISQSSGQLTTNLFGSCMNGGNFQLSGLVGYASDLPGAWSNGVVGTGGVGANVWPANGVFDAIKFPGGAALAAGGNPGSNSVWHNLGPDAMFAVSGGTYSQVTLNNVTMLTGSITTPTVWRVPSGGSIKVTYSSAPSYFVASAQSAQFIT
jgi:hypothetical protein